MKRSESGNSRTDVANVDSSMDAENREQDTTDLHSVKEAELDSLAGCESEAFGNWIHCFLVTSPAGRAFHSYRLESFWKRCVMPPWRTSLC